MRFGKVTLAQRRAKRLGTASHASPVPSSIPSEQAYPAVYREPPPEEGSCMDPIAHILTDAHAAVADIRDRLDAFAGEA